MTDGRKTSSTSWKDVTAFPEMDSTKTFIIEQWKIPQRTHILRLIAV